MTVPKIEFIITIPKEDWLAVNSDGVNRQMLAKFIRDELRACGGQHHPEDWRNWVLKRTCVKTREEKK